MLYAWTEKPRLKSLPSSSQQMKKQHAPRSLSNMTELLPCYISSVKKSLFSMSGLKHVYTTTAQWQVMIHNAQSSKKQINKRAEWCEVIWIRHDSTRVLQSNIKRNEMRASGNLMKQIFNYLECPARNMTVGIHQPEWVICSSTCFLQFTLGYTALV